MHISDELPTRFVGLGAGRSWSLGRAGPGVNLWCCAEDYTQQCPRVNEGTAATHHKFRCECTRQDRLGGRGRGAVLRFGESPNSEGSPPLNRARILPREKPPH